MFLWTWSQLQLLKTVIKACHEYALVLDTFIGRAVWSSSKLWLCQAQWALLGGKIYLSSEAYIDLYHGHGSLGIVFTQQWTCARLSTLHTFGLKTIHWWQALYQGEKSPSLSQTRGMTVETEDGFWICSFGLQWEAAHKLFEGPKMLPFHSLCYSCLKLSVPRVISKETHSNSKKSGVSWNEEIIFSNLDWKKTIHRVASLYRTWRQSWTVWDIWKMSVSKREWANTIWFVLYGEESSKLNCVLGKHCFTRFGHFCFL